MKKLIALVVFAFVGIQHLPAQRISSLPIGSPEVVKNHLLRLVDGGDTDLYEVTNLVTGAKRLIIEESGFRIETHPALFEGFIHERMKIFLSDYRERFKEGHTYVTGFYASAPVSTYESLVVISAESKMFVPEKDASGQLVAPESASQLSVDYFGSDMPIKAPGVYWVVETWGDAGGYLLAKQFSQNGDPYDPSVAKLHSMYRGPNEGKNFGYTSGAGSFGQNISRNGDLFDSWVPTLYGNGFIYPSAAAMTGDGLRGKGDWGAIALYYDEEQTDWDRFDILTGQKMASSREVKVQISRTYAGITVTVVGGDPNLPVVIEGSTDFKNWGPISTASGGKARTASLEQSSEYRFFRARVDAAPVSTASHP